ncbi:alpha-L-fucosidase [Flavivirga eckloniae]|uniref:alpha-L-fucosidase n=1 Tax=Flavivirga eckloniae TaxID=1803846 RepID=A0A2K9PTZ6_9FLAO|nr:alpha-L-fucosidase [Flavivirga eckloniae]AUP80531.1 alpha-L-fucosidase [Flavivirga eckloniae]
MKAALIAFFLIVTCISHAQETSEQVDKNRYEANWESLKKHKTPDWYIDGKFGIYFHWGVYSVPAFGTEWYPRHMYIDNKEGWGKEVRPHHLEKYGADFDYHEFIPSFTAEHFDAKEWAALFKASGASWAGPVAEHCDNFSMWDSKINPWNASKMGPKRDIVGALEKAIKGEGLKFTTTFHHSWNWAWYDTWSGNIDVSTPELRQFYGEEVLPGTFNKMSSGSMGNGAETGKIEEKYKPSKKFISTWRTKIDEVVDTYKPDMLWFDSRLFIIPEKERQEMVAHYYNKSLEWNKPVVLNYKNKDLAEGAGVIDLERGRFDEKTAFYWLTDDSWDWSGWNYKENHDYKSADRILDGLVDIVSKNGCLLLNIGPKADGTIPEEVKKGLLELGGWLKIHGEAIYKTRPFVTYGEGKTKLKKNHWGGVNDRGITYTANDFRFTTRDGYLYILQLGMPKPNKEFRLKSFAKNGLASDVKIESLELLGSVKNTKWHQNSKGLYLTSPEVNPNKMVLVYKAKISN